MRFIVLFVLCLLGAAHEMCDAEAPRLDHYGKPLSADLSGFEGITVADFPYPDQPKGEIISADGHRFILVEKYGGAGHTNIVQVFIRSPRGKDLRVTFQTVYGDTSKYWWINEDLLFVRIWWGRHWGSDYIFDADTAKMVYSEEIEEHHFSSP